MDCRSRIARLLAAYCLVTLSIPAFPQAARSPFDLPPPTRSAPYLWVNMHGLRVEFNVTPWQLVDLGTYGPMHIFAGDHCSVPSKDPVSEAYKKVFSASCDLHDICYFVPGNSKRFCDDFLKWHMDIDCEHAYHNDIAKGQCRLTAISWRAGLETPISTQYWDRSQEWGRRNSRLLQPGENPTGTK